MSLRITKKGIHPYSPQEKEVPPKLFAWLKFLQLIIPWVSTYSPSLTPTSVGGTSESTQTFTVNGLTTSDIVYINPPDLAAGLGVMYVRVSAVNTLQVRFRNFTGGSLTPASGTYYIVAIKL